MPADLLEKQFELEDVSFGLGCPVEVSDWVPGAPNQRIQDEDMPSGDGVRMGVDTRGSATWAFSLYTNARTEREGYQSLAYLKKAWDGDDVRSESEYVTALRYCLAGETRRVYGRPRRWTPTFGPESLNGRIMIEADFATVDDVVYGDELHTEVIPLSPVQDLDAGIVVPFDLPFIPNSASHARESAITVGGDRPTPMIVTFVGGMQRASVRIGDWTAELVDPVFDGDPVTIDARPWIRAATTQSGGGVRIAPRVTRISKMWLPPGLHEVVFTGTSTSGEGTVLVSWREAFRTPR